MGLMRTPDLQTDWTGSGALPPDRWMGGPQMKPQTLSWLAGAIAVSLLTACVVNPSPTPPLLAGATPSLETLSNLSYASELVEGGAAELEDGLYQAPAAPESASQISIQLTEWIASGDLNGVPSAAVVLVGSGGGSGSFYSLHVVQEVDGAYQEVASTLLGDRVIVEGLAIQEDTVQVRMITHGPDDPMCCPTLPVLKLYKLEGDQLIEVSMQVVS